MDMLNVIISSSIVSLLLVISGYFINMWIVSINESIDRMQSKLDIVNNQVTELETSIGIIRNLQQKQYDKTTEIIDKSHLAVDHVSKSVEILKKESVSHQKTLENYGEIIRKYLLPKK